MPRGSSPSTSFPDWFGFEQTKEFLGSNVEYVQGSVYSLARLVGEAQFDLVLFWGVLYHLRTRCSRSTRCGRWRRVDASTSRRR